MTPDFGVVDAISHSSGASPLRIRVRLGDELVRDVIAITPLRTTLDLAPGDRVLLFQDAAGTGERYALPIAIASRRDVWRIQVDGAELVLDSGAIVAQSMGGTGKAVATKDDLQNLVNWLKTLKLPVSGATAGPPDTTNLPSPAGTQRFRAE